MSSSSKPERESDILHAILREFGALPNIRLFRMNCGAAKDRASGRIIRFGIPGQADISGIIAPSGRRLEIEVKSKKGTQSDKQFRWQTMIRQFGGLYILARSVDEVRKALEKAGVEV